MTGIRQRIIIAACASLIVLGITAAASAVDRLVDDQIRAVLVTEQQECFWLMASGKRIDATKPHMAMFPETVPVFTEHNGALFEGAWFIHRITDPADVAFAKVPIGIVRLPDGAIVLETEEFMRVSPSCEFSLGIVESVPFSSQVTVSPHRDMDRLRGPFWRITYTLPEELPEGWNRDAVDAAVERVRARLEAVFYMSAGFALVEVRFEVPIGQESAATMVTFRTPAPSIVFVRDRLLNGTELNTEEQIYMRLPENLQWIGPNMLEPFNTDTVRVPVAAFRNFQGVFSFVPDGVIRINPQVAWVFDTRERPADASAFDFEATLLHETLHVLGFASGADSIIPDLNLWDVFRFPATLGPAIAPAHVTTAIRELRPEMEAVALLSIGQGGTRPLSRGNRPGGDDQQASHWKAYTALVPQVPIGIMDPNPSLAAEHLGGRKWTQNDVDAIDRIGYIADRDVPIAAAPPSLVAPVDGGVGISLIPLFEWMWGGWAEQSHLYVYRGQLASEATRVFSVTGLLAAEFQLLQESRLRPGLVYSWRVTTENAGGFSYSASSVFTTLGCSADWTADGAVNSLDLSEFITGWLASVGTGTLEADFNGDGVVNSSDLSSFVTSWLEQVELNCAL